MSHFGENMNSHDDAVSEPAKDVSGGDTVVYARRLSKSFRTADGLLHVLNGVDLSIRRGEMVSVVGESGAGKSTLLHILGGLDASSGGELEVCGVRYSEMSDNEIARFRTANIGFVFQFHHLLADFTALENVMIPKLIRRERADSARTVALKLLDLVGLSDRVSHRPGKLSGGEQQRVAVARALANNPQLILADEPSGNLDTKTATSLHSTLSELNRRTGMTMVIATHNRDLASQCNRVFELSSGSAVCISS
jgi:lipoprotein-releasing system ATP-binding protein